jgi:quercetin dioxygenase-like cupin family protein
MRKSLLVLTLIGAMVVGAAALAQAPTSGSGHVMLRPAEVNWVDAPPILPKGAKLAVIEGVLANPGPFTFRLQLPAGYKVAPHWHPAIEHVTVISGTLNFGMGEKFDAKQMKPLPAGSFVAIPPQTPHFVSVKGAKGAVVQVHGVGPWGLTYVNPADDPSKK